MSRTVLAPLRPPQRRSGAARAASGLAGVAAQAWPPRPYRCSWVDAAPAPASAAAVIHIAGLQAMALDRFEAAPVLAQVALEHDQVAMPHLSAQAGQVRPVAHHLWRKRRLKLRSAGRSPFGRSRPGTPSVASLPRRLSGAPALRLHPHTSQIRAQSLGS